MIDYSLQGLKIAEHLDCLCGRYGSPRALIRDDGVELRSKHFQMIINKWRIPQEVIPLEHPFDNGTIESYHGKMRKELLNMKEFEKLSELRESVLN